LGLKVSGVHAGDRVANLFYAGDLYGSFLLHILSVYELEAGIQIPIAGHISTEDMIRHITELQTQVVLSTVTTMVKIASRLRQENKTLDFVETLLFSGEALYEDQIPLLEEAFPNAKVRSLIYGTMECGVIGIPSTEKDTRIHQLLPEVMVEIVTESGPVVTPGVPGELIITNPSRRLMPIVRYSCGDRGEWVNYEEGLFRLLGRQTKSVRLGPVSFDILHIRQCITRVLGQYDGMQAVVRRFEQKDQLVMRIASQESSQHLAAPAIVSELGRERPMLKEHIEKGLIAPVVIEFVPYSELVINTRSGKAIEIVDERLAGATAMKDKRI
jgi:phenylacetate-CoA ligase